MVAAARLDPFTMSNLSFRLALLLLTLPAGIAAQPAAAPPMTAPPQQVSLHYLGEPDCPSEAEFVAEVTARVRRPVQWSVTGAALQMVVIVRHASEHADGTLEVVQRSTETTRREFTSGSCAEVGSALALVAALTLDPNARTEQLPARAPSAPAREVAPARPSALTPPAAPAPPLVRRARVDSAAPAPGPASSGGYVAWLGPTGAVVAGYASEPLVVAGLSLGVRGARRGFAPGFQLTPMWGKTGTTGPETAGGSFSWAIARLEACPTRFELVRGLTFEPCAAAELGSLSARGAGVGITPDPVERWWFAAGATLSLHLRLGSWFARLTALGLLPVTRDEFVFHDPNRIIHQANFVVAGGGLGLGFQFGS